MTLPEFIKEAREIEAKASPAPWLPSVVIGYPCGADNSELISFSRNNFTKMLDAMEKMEVALSKLSWARVQPEDIAINCLAEIEKDLGT